MVVEGSPRLASARSPLLLFRRIFSRPSPHWIYSPHSASIHLNISSIDFQIIATLSKRRMQWLKISSKFIGILCGDYRILMKWLPCGRVRATRNPRWETGVCCIGTVFLRVNAEERVSEPRAGRALLRRTGWLVRCLFGGSLKGESLKPAHRKVGRRQWRRLVLWAGGALTPPSLVWRRQETT